MIRKSGKNWEKYFILEKKYSRVYFKCFYLCFTKEKEERVVIYLQLFPLFSKWCHQQPKIGLYSTIFQ